MNTETLTLLITIGTLGLVQASFQLSVSMLTVMSGHALGKRSSHQRVLKLLFGFTAGAGIITMLILSTISLFISAFVKGEVPLIAWASACGLSIGLGVATWVFYYRRKSKGTSLWLPQDAADYLYKRSKATRQSIEAFALGMTSVVIELIFLVAPLILTSLILIDLDPIDQLIGVLVYSFVATLPLIIITLMVGGGHNLSKVQKWRERNKHFNQFIAGSALIIIGFYLYVDFVTTSIRGGI